MVWINIILDIAVLFILILIVRAIKELYDYYEFTEVRINILSAKMKSLINFNDKKKGKRKK